MCRWIKVYIINHRVDDNQPPYGRLPGLRGLKAHEKAVHLIVDRILRNEADNQPNVKVENV
jgi:hypothetical protein